MLKLQAAECRLTKQWADEDLTVELLERFDCLREDCLAWSPHVATYLHETEAPIRLPITASEMQL